MMSDTRIPQRRSCVSFIRNRGGMAYGWVARVNRKKTHVTILPCEVQARRVTVPVEQVVGPVSTKLTCPF